MKVSSKLYCHARNGREIIACVRRLDGARLSDHDGRAIGLALADKLLSPLETYLSRLREMERYVEPTRRIHWASKRIGFIYRMHATEQIHGQRLRPYYIQYFDPHGIPVEATAYEDSLCALELNSFLSIPS